MYVFTYNSNALVVTGSRVGIGINNPVAKLQVNGNISGSSFTGSVFGTSSWATNALSASYAPGGGTTLTTGSTYPITSSWAINAISSSFASTSVTATSATSANSATSASYSLSSSYSVNRIVPATEAAFSIAVRVTLVGSIMPASFILTKNNILNVNNNFFICFVC